METTGLANTLHNLSELLPIACHKIMKRAVSEHYAISADIEAVRSIHYVCCVIVNMNLVELAVYFLYDFSCSKGLVPLMGDLIVMLLQSCRLRLTLYILS